MTLTLPRLLTIIVAVVSMVVPALLPDAGYATKYGTGSYGRCQYQTCAVSMSSLVSVAVDITPTNSGARCSVAKDTVTVTTSSSTGYVLTLIDGDASNALSLSGQAIQATSGTFASPVTLAANTWGYRIDSQGGFGAGPTSTLSSAPTPTIAFAKVQPSTGTADTIVTTSVAATNGSATDIWYGVCVNGSQPSGSYADSVLYTAIVN